MFALEYNPVTDHVVAVGKKFIRFFGVKEGVEDPHSDARDAKLSSHESKLWAKRGVFGKRALQQDLMCVGFDTDGVTYAGTSNGYIYRFAEQNMDLAVRAHWLGAARDGKECKVTALWYSPWRHELVSPGDDGFIKVCRYPCVVPRARAKEYVGHSSHVTNVAFSSDDSHVLSTGGDDRAVFQWKVTRT